MRIPTRQGGSFPEMVGELVKVIEEESGEELFMITFHGTIIFNSMGRGDDARYDKSCGCPFIIVSHRGLYSDWSTSSSCQWNVATGYSSSLPVRLMMRAICLQFYWRC